MCMGISLISVFWVISRCILIGWCAEMKSHVWIWSNISSSVRFVKPAVWFLKLWVGFSSCFSLCRVSGATANHCSCFCPKVPRCVRASADHHAGCVSHKGVLVQHLARKGSNIICSASRFLTPLQPFVSLRALFMRRTLGISPRLIPLVAPHVII